MNHRRTSTRRKTTVVGKTAPHKHAMRKRANSNSTTGVKGVYPTGKKFRSIAWNHKTRKNVYLGTYKTTRAAKIAYNKFMKMIA